MKLQIDTTNKTIRIEEAVKFDELFNTLESLFPNSAWREYTLVIFMDSSWSTPATFSFTNGTTFGVQNLTPETKPIEKFPVRNKQ